MKIDASHTYPQPIGPQGVGTTGAAPGQNEGVSANLSTDQAQCSVDSTKLQQLKSSLAGVPEVRQDRVAALQQAIASGSYKVSGQQIAESMSSDLFDKA